MLADYFKDKKASLFALEWPSTKPMNLAEEAARKVVGVKKGQDYSSYIKMVSIAR